MFWQQKENMDEKSSLLPSNASGSGSSYYFLKGEQAGQTDSVRDTDGGEVVETIPDGANEDEFASRPVGVRVSISDYLQLV